MVTDIIDWAARAGDLLYLIVFLLVLGESALFLDLFVPGEVGLVLASATVRQADGNLVLLIGLAALGATAGDSISYWLGRRLGPGLAHRWKFTRRHLEPSLERARHRFERHGGWAVFGARWVGALRAVVPAVAGAAGMTYGRFLVWSASAAVLWATAVGCLGWYAGDAAARLIDRLGWWVSVIVVGVLVVWWFVRRRKRRAVNRSDPSDRSATNETPTAG